MKTNRLLLAMTLTAALLCGTKLFAQQEVNADWYDPWPASAHVTAHAPQPQIAQHKSEPKLVSGAVELKSGKQLLTQTRQSQVAAAPGLTLHQTPQLLTSNALPLSSLHPTSARFNLDSKHAVPAPHTAITQSSPQAIKVARATDSTR